MVKEIFEIPPRLDTVNQILIDMKKSLDTMKCQITKTSTNFLSIFFMSFLAVQTMHWKRTKATQKYPSFLVIDFSVKDWLVLIHLISEIVSGQSFLGIF